MINLKKILSILIILCFFIIRPSWAADIYIDPDWSGTESGTFAEPYNSWHDVTFTQGNDYRQKCGSSETTTSTLTVDASGTAVDYIIIGAYYDNAGSPVHEDDSPSYGGTCGNDAAKPIFTETSRGLNDNGTVLVTGDYIDVNSIELAYGSRTIRLYGSYNKVQYCRVMNGRGGIYTSFNGSYPMSNAYIGYNYVYTDMGYDSNENDDLDGIHLGAYDDTSVVEYNVVDGFAHGAIVTDRSDNHIVRYNSVYSWDDNTDLFLSVGGDDNKFLYNYCYDCGIIDMPTANGCEVAYNIVDTFISRFKASSQKGIISVQPLRTGIDVSDNKIHNNVFYDGSGTTSVRWYGIAIVASEADAGVVERNSFYNNVFIDVGQGEPAGSEPVIKVEELYGLSKIESGGASADANTYYNNLSYNHENSTYARIEGVNYAAATDFNVYGKASDNREDDPGLSNPADGEFWPDDADDNVVNTGYDAVGDTNDILVYTTAWGTSTILAIIQLNSAPLYPYIGAYSLDHYYSPADGSTDVAVSANLIWENVSGVTQVNTYLEDVSPPTTLVVDGENVEIYDPPTDFALNDTFYWRVDPYVDGEFVTGRVLSFGTSGGPPVTSGSKITAKRNIISGLPIVHHKNGVNIK